MISIITSTNKPRQMHNIFKNYLNQDWNDKELIIILNRDNMNINRWTERAMQYPNISVFQLPAKVTLGECLNFAVSKTKYDIIAKFDDDDYYSPYYTAQAMQVFKEKQADIVGKSELFTYFEKNKNLCIRKANNPIGGGTIMFHKKVFQTVQFPDANTGEDGGFVKKAQRKGFQLMTTNKFNYVYIRKSRKFHTWKVSEKALLQKCTNCINTDSFEPHVIQAP